MRHIGIILWCGLILTGMIMVGLTGCAFMAQLIGVSDGTILGYFSQNISVDLSFVSDLGQKYPRYHSRIEQYSYLVDGIENGIENLCTISAPINSQCEGVASWYKNTLLGADNDLHEYPQVLAIETEEAYEDVMGLYEFCRNEGIPFTFVLEPSELRYNMECFPEKVIEKDTLKRTDVEHADELVNLLKSSGVDVCNLSEKRTFLESLSYFEAHWACEDALSASNMVFRHIHNMDDSYHPVNCYADGYVDVLKDYSEEELGYDYSLPIPMDDGNYTVIMNELTVYDGSFAETFLRDKDTWSDSINKNRVYHNIWRLTNGDLLQAVNNSDRVENRRILLLGDSFAWPISAYLAQYYKYVDALNPGFFPGSTLSYIEKTRPDMVILMYVDPQINVKAVYNAYGKLIK